VNDNDLSKELYKKYSSVSLLLSIENLAILHLILKYAYCQVHRRKVRVWQMICVLSHYVEEDIVEEVTSSAHVCLYVRTFLILRITLLSYACIDASSNGTLLFLQRNNLPAVRQFLETFAILIYLKFPTLVRAHLCHCL
jgi:hypothetical protein